jgi:hypothetical protein
VKPGTAKAKGRATENQAVDWLIEQGWVAAERRRLNGDTDKGDVAGVPGLCIEVKSAAEWKPVQWMRECTAETINARADLGFVMARPKGGTDVANWAIIMTPATLLQLLNEAGRGPLPWPQPTRLIDMEELRNG